LTSTNALWRTSHEISARLRLWKGNHLANVLLARKNRHQAINTKSETGVRGCSIFERTEQETKTNLGLFVANTQCTENPRLNIRSVDTNGPAAQLPTV